MESRREHLESPRDHRERAPRLGEARTPRDYHITDFRPADLDEVAALFRQVFRREVAIERVRRGLGYRYVDNPYTGHPRTAPLVVRHGSPAGPVIAFFGCLPTRVVFRGEERISGFLLDFFVSEEFQARRLGVVLLRALLARTAEVIFTSSAGPVTQALLRYYGVIPIPEFQPQWALPVERLAGGAPPNGVRGVLRRLTGPRLALVPIDTIDDGMVALAAAHTEGATFQVQRTRRYLDWRFGPLIRAAAPECEILGLADRGRRVGWLVARRQQASLELLDCFVPASLHGATLALLGRHGLARGCTALTGRGMQAALRRAALDLGASEAQGLMLYWTWCPDRSVYDGMDWSRAYLSATDGDLTLPWNLDPVMAAS